MRRAGLSQPVDGPARHILRGLAAGCVFGFVAGGRPAFGQSADSAVIFGRINLAIERVDVPGGSPSKQSRLSNNRSVLGFKGTEDLGDGFKAIWQIEGSVGPDTGSGSIASRDTRVGLSGAWGTLFAGSWALPYTAATSSFDPFYPTTAGYMALLGNGSAALADNVSNSSSFDRRQQNVVQYWSPAWSGLSAQVAYAFNEEAVAATGAKPWLVSGSASYVHAPWSVTIAHEIHRAYQIAGGSDTGSKLGVSYELTALRVAAAVERLKYQTASGELTRVAAYVSARYRQGAATLLGGYSRALDGRGGATQSVGFIGSGSATSANQITVGAEYAFSRRTSVFAYFSRIGNDSAAAYDFAINQAGVRPGEDPRVFALGIRHDF
jgi:predicted porin